MVRQALVAFILVLYGCSPPATGVLVEKVYAPSVSGSGYGYGYCSGVAYDGTYVSGTCSGIVYYNEPEKWVLVLRGVDGQVRSRLVSANEWADADVGFNYE